MEQTQQEKINKKYSIPLTRGKSTLLDKIDYKWAKKYKWHYMSVGYAARDSSVVNGQKKHKIYMHREIMKTPKGLETDHINCDKLDNRRENLRICRKKSNTLNKLKRTDNTSGYIGVYWWKLGKLWIASVQKQGKVWREYYETKEEAILKREELVKRVHKKFARLNLIGEKINDRRTDTIRV